MNTLTEEDVDDLRARLDAEPTPPDGDWLDDTPTVECDVPIIHHADPDNLRVLHLTAHQWSVIDDLRRLGVPVRGVGEGCAYTPFPPSSWASNYWTVSEMLTEADVLFRKSPVMGGTFLLFDTTPAFPDTPGV